MPRECPRCLMPIRECICDEDEEQERPELTPTFREPDWPEDVA